MNYTIGLCILAAIVCYACVHIIRKRRLHQDNANYDIPNFLRSDGAPDIPSDDSQFNAETRIHPWGKTK